MNEGVRRFRGGCRVYIREDVGSWRWLVLTVRYWPPRVQAQVIDWPRAALKFQLVLRDIRAAFAAAAASMRALDAALTMPPEKAVPPKPDPCLVVLRASESARLTERDWREARRCPHGCGETCKGLR